MAALFFVNGVAFASWLPRIPEVRDRLDIGLGTLGLVLLGSGLGGLLASAGGGALVDRLGSRRSCVAAAALLSAGLPLIGVAASPLALGAVLVSLGAVDVLADIGMNVQAAQVQRDSSASVVQRFHGAWSVGSLTGAAIAASAAAAGISIAWQLVATSVVLILTVALASRQLSPLDDAPAPRSEGTSRASVLALLAAAALATAMVEGTPGEWAAVFGTDVHGAGPALAGLGFLAMSAGMVTGRFAGDAATDRLGATRLVRVALGVVGVGLTAVVASPGAIVAIVGFGVIGLGVSVLFPALYLSAAGREGIPAGLGLGVMSTGARLGFLVSPPLVGAIAGATSLRVALGVVVGTAAVGTLVLDAALSRAGRPAT